MVQTSKACSKALGLVSKRSLGSLRNTLHDLSFPVDDHASSSELSLTLFSTSPRPDCLPVANLGKQLLGWRIVRQQRRNQDHHSIQHDEIHLILHDEVCPAACHLRNTVATPLEDGKEGKHEPGSEELELGICCVEAECHFCYLKDSGLYAHESCCPGNQCRPLTYVGRRRFWYGP